jgi:hypothetical protein
MKMFLNIFISILLFSSSAQATSIGLSINVEEVNTTVVFLRQGEHIGSGPLC